MLHGRRFASDCWTNAKVGVVTVQYQWSSPEPFITFVWILIIIKTLTLSEKLSVKTNISTHPLSSTSRHPRLMIHYRATTNSPEGHQSLWFGVQRVPGHIFPLDRWSSNRSDFDEHPNSSSVQDIELSPPKMFWSSPTLDRLSISWSELRHADHFARNKTPTRCMRLELYMKTISHE